MKTEQKIFTFKYGVNQSGLMEDYSKQVSEYGALGYQVVSSNVSSIVTGDSRYAQRAQGLLVVVMEKITETTD